MHEYDLIADSYASHRTGQMGVPEVTALAAALPAGAWVLDFGCGTELPLTRVLLKHGCHVLGVDSSANCSRDFKRTSPMCRSSARPSSRVSFRRGRSTRRSHGASCSTCATKSRRRRSPISRGPLSLGKSRYGTDQPQVDIFLPRGSSHRETSAMIYTFAASLELRTPTRERWIAQTERLEEANPGRVYLELAEGDHAEAMRGMALLNAVLPR